MTDQSKESLLGFTYQGAIEVRTPDGDGVPKTIEFTTTISKECSQEDLDSLVDKCRLAIERQRVFVYIDKTVATLRELEGGIALKHREISLKDQQFAKRAEEHPGRAERGMSAGEKVTREKDIEGLQIAALNKKALEEKLSALRVMIEPRDDDCQVRAVPTSNGEAGEFPFA